MNTDKKNQLSRIEEFISRVQTLLLGNFLIESNIEFNLSDTKVLEKEYFVSTVFDGKDKFYILIDTDTSLFLASKILNIELNNQTIIDDDIKNTFSDIVLEWVRLYNDKFEVKTVVVPSNAVENQLKQLDGIHRVNIDDSFALYISSGTAKLEKNDNFPNLVNIIKTEIVNSYTALLSVKTQISSFEKVIYDSLVNDEFVCADFNYEFKQFKTNLTLIAPTNLATYIEYMMLGKITDLKDSIDNEIVDAFAEICDTCVGSIATVINAQSFDSIAYIKRSLNDCKKVDTLFVKERSNLYKIGLVLNEIKFDLLVSFGNELLPFIEENDDTLYMQNQTIIDKKDKFKVEKPSKVIIEKDDIVPTLQIEKVKLQGVFGDTNISISKLIDIKKDDIIKLENKALEDFYIEVNGKKRKNDYEPTQVDGKIVFKKRFT